MSSEVEIYKRALKAIYEVYKWSEYGDNDLYRIKDIIHSLNENHWASKRWLVEKIRANLNVLKNMYEGSSYTVGIFGGWYGLLAYLFRQTTDGHVMSLDSDEMAKTIGSRIFSGSDINWVCEDLFEHENKDFDVVCNTSCEHLDRDDLKQWIGSFKPGTLFALQSNNDAELMSHVNTSDTLEEFEEYVKDALPHQNILYAGELPQSGMKRWMIIGR